MSPLPEVPTVYWQAIVRTIWSSLNKERMSHLCGSDHAETMYWQANANTPLSVTPLLNVPDIRREITSLGALRARHPRGLAACKFCVAGLPASSLTIADVQARSGIRGLCF